VSPASVVVPMVTTEVSSGSFVIEAIFVPDGG
jgi:hypothetical protein